MAENNVSVLLEKHRSHHSYFHVIVAIIGRLLADTREEHDSLKEHILNETNDWFNNQQALRRRACLQLVQRQFRQLDPQNQGRLSDLILTYYKCEQTFEITMREMLDILRPLYNANADPLNDIPTLAQINTKHQNLPGFQSLSDFISEIKKELKLVSPVVKSIQFKQKTGKPFEYDCCGCNEVMKLVRSLNDLAERLEGGDPLQIKHSECAKDYVEQIITRKDAELRKSDADKWTQVIMKEVRDAVTQQMKTIDELRFIVNNYLDLASELTAESAKKEQQKEDLKEQLRKTAGIAASNQVKLENKRKEWTARLAEMEELMGIKAEIKVEGEEGEEQTSTSQQHGGQVVPNATVKKEVDEEEDPSNTEQEGDNTDEAVEALNAQMSEHRIE